MSMQEIVHRNKGGRYALPVDVRNRRRSLVSKLKVSIAQMRKDIETPLEQKFDQIVERTLLRAMRNQREEAAKAMVRQAELFDQRQSAQAEAFAKALDEAVAKVKSASPKAPREPKEKGPGMTSRTDWPIIPASTSQGIEVMEVETPFASPNRTFASLAGRPNELGQTFTRHVDKAKTLAKSVKGREPKKKNKRRRENPDPRAQIVSPSRRSPPRRARDSSSDLTRVRQ